MERKVVMERKFVMGGSPIFPALIKDNPDRVTQIFSGPVETFVRTYSNYPFQNVSDTYRMMYLL